MADETEIARMIRAARERRGATYHGYASGDLDDLVGGRFAKVVKATVVSNEPIGRYPGQPVNSPWACEPLGVEPALGYSVDEMEPTGEVHEQVKSAAPAASSATSEDSGATWPSGQVRLRRRI